MANPVHVEMLVNSTKDEWNKWREERRYELLEISNLNLGQMRRDAVGPIDGTWANFRDFNFDSVNLKSCTMVQSDLSGATLSWIEWDNVVLIGSIVRDSLFYHASFKSCFMHRMDAVSAKIWWTSFPNSSLHDVDFSRAFLHYSSFAEADLTGAQFDGCDLSMTNLIGASLACTNLNSAKYICGSSEDFAYFDETERLLGESKTNPSRVRIESLRERLTSGVPDQPPSSPTTRDAILRNLTKLDPFGVDDIEQIKSAVKIIYDVVSAGTGRGMARLYYRGHGCTCWNLTSSLARMESDGSESEMLDELAMSSPEEFRQCRSELERLVLARHHGLPTRFLDVTLNVLVALYFACTESASCRRSECDGNARLHCIIAPPEIVKRHHSDTVSVLSAFTRLTRAEQLVLLTERPTRGCRISDVLESDHVHFSRPSYGDAMLRLRHFVAREKPYFEDRIDPKDLFRVVVVEPDRAFPRLRAQSGAFLMSAFHESFDAEEVASVDPAMSIYGHVKFDIPPQAKARILRELGFYHVNEETMFLGLESAARAIIARHTRHG